MDLDEYQERANQTDQRPGSDEKALAFPLMGLASEVGSLLNQYKKRVRDGEAHDLFSDRVAEELGDIMWYVANLTQKLDLSLNGLAELNLRRVGERWPVQGSTQPANLLDDSYEESERLPRSADVAFVESQEEGRARVRLFWEGDPIGDPISDMAWDPDSYRYHDVFHLTYAAILGWSPISRFLFSRQRSVPQFREVEDSGRAKVVEEAVSILAFNYAQKERFLDGVDHIDSSLLRTITDMVSGYEVRIRTVRDWEQAIIRSFEMWRLLSVNHGGVIHIDMLAREISFATTP